MYKHIFDLDNTLVYTNALNSDAYNYALLCLGKPQIQDGSRITRETVYARYQLTDAEKEALLTQKRNYFNANLDKISPNEKLIKLLSDLPAGDCLLWTSAEKCRTEAILNHLNLKHAFSMIFYSDKTNLKDDLEWVCKYFSCCKSQLKFYENDEQILYKINKILSDESKI